QAPEVGKRPTHYPRWQMDSSHEHRRVTAAYQRCARRNEPGWATPTDARRGSPLRTLAPPAAKHSARCNKSVAGQRAQQSPLRGTMRPGYLLHRKLVYRAGYSDFAPLDPTRAAGDRGVLMISSIRG